MKLQFFCLLGSLVFFTGVLQGQVGDSLRRVIVAKEDSLNIIEQNYQRVQQTLEQLNEDIFRQKKKSESSYNPLLWLTLNYNLKISSGIAAEMESIQTDRQRIQRELQNDYRQMVVIMDSLIAEKMQAVYTPSKDISKRALLNTVNQWEAEKKSWQKKLSQATSGKEATLPQLALEPGDTVERLGLKMKLLQDYLDKVHADLTALRNRRRKLQMDLQIYREMVSFTENLQQVSDPEQEYFDQERIDHLRDEVRNTNLEIAAIEEQITRVTNEETRLVRTRREITNQLERKLKK